MPLLSGLTFESLSISIADLLPSSPPLLALCPPPAGYTGPRSIATFQTPVSKYFEPVGTEYQRRYGVKYGIKEEVKVEKVEKKKESAKELALSKVKFHSIKDNINEDNYYDLLCLPDGMEYTEEELTLRFKKLCLLYHPDKAMPEDREKTEQRFKLISIAYETFLDPSRRKTWESTIDFDDSIPEKDSKKDFLKEYGAVFKRNGRFSVVTPVPKLGDMNTSIDEVRSFYDFWYSFKSFRDFKVKGDHDVNKAEGRDEKRWMEKENDKLRTGKRKEEAARIRELVQQAELLDPRLLKHKNDEKQKRLAEKEEKANAKLAKQREIENAAKAEQDRKDAEAAAAKEEAAKLKATREAEKQQAKKVRSSLRKYTTAANALLNDNAINVTDEDIDLISRAGSMDAIVIVLSTFHSALPDVVPQPSPALDLSKSAPIADSSEDQLAKVVLAMSKFRELLVSLKSPKELEEEAKAKALADKLKAEKEAKAAVVKVSKPWTRDELSLLSKACTKYPAGTQRRWESISSFVGSRSTDEVIVKAKELLAHAEVSRVEVKSEPAAPAVVEPPKPVVEDKKVVAAPEPVVIAPEDVWSPEEQTLFEAALKKYHATDSDRWDKVAKDVSSKNKKQCAQRFKEIRQKLLDGKK